MRRTSQRGSAMADASIAQLAGGSCRRFPSAIDLRAEYVESGVKEVLDELDRDLIGLKPVKQRIKETAALAAGRAGTPAAWASRTKRRRCT